MGGCVLWKEELFAVLVYTNAANYSTPEIQITGGKVFPERSLIPTYMCAVFAGGKDLHVSGRD